MSEAIDSPEPTTATHDARPTLRGMSEIRSFFRTNTTPIFFVGPTPFNLLGLDRWVRNLYYVTYYDSFEGAHPRVFTPTDRPYVEFTSPEDVTNYLLRHSEVVDFIRSKGPGAKLCSVMFDAETEEIAAELGIDVILPPDRLRRHLDSKVVTTRLGDEAGAPSVPNVLGRAESYTELQGLASTAGLDDDLVVQLPYGDSGKTTFFIANEDDYDRCADELAGQDLKIMRRINNKAAAVEAVITRFGTVVGPFMVDLTGYRELTPYPGGWCGNDLFPEALAAHHRARARDLIQRLGRRLREEGYVGFFEVDVLVDLDTDEVYLGEINPRISGASSLTHVTAGAYADVPLFLFHLLEYLDVEYEIDVNEINERWDRLAATDVWSQLIIKEPQPVLEQITAAPRTGVWRLNDDGSLVFVRTGFDWHSILDEREAFFLRVYGPGDYLFKGADYGVLVTRGRLQSDEHDLTDRCRQWISGLTAHYRSKPLPADSPDIRPRSYKF